MQIRVACCLAALGMLGLYSPAEAAPYDIRPVVLESETIVPGGGFISQLTWATGTTDAGEVLVGGRVWDGFDLKQKLFLLGGPGAGGRVILEAGEQAPDGRAWTEFGARANGAGDIAFIALADSTTVGMWKRTGSGDAEILIEGGPAPLPGATWTPTAIPESISDGGLTLFYAVAATAGGDRDGWFLDGPSGPQTVVLNGDVAPGGGTFGNITLGTAAQIDDAGLIFAALLNDGSTTGGLYRWDAGVITPFVVAGDPVPTPGGGTFDWVAWPAANRAGVVVFAAGVNRGGPTRHALFTYDGTTFIEI